MAERKTYTAEDFKGCNGRRVLVEGVITDIRPEYGPAILVKFDPKSDARSLPKSAIVEILPEEIGILDKVRASGIPGVAEVRYIDGDYAWLLYHESGIRNDAPLSDLTLVERGQ